MNIKRIISVFLLAAMLVTVSRPALAASNSTDNTLTVSNKYISITVNKKNGGFYINTVEGDILKKSDDNKSLLYRSADFDTSFSTFRVIEEGTGVKDYIFGNQYGFLGTATSGVVSTREDGSITSVWSVGNIKVTQRLALSNISDGETSGTVQIGYTVENTGSRAVKVDVRALLDTMLDNRDCAIYELAKPGQGTGYLQVEKETTVKGGDIPASFFAYNDSFSPTVASYSINEKLPDVKKPYQIIFAHWNNLASTVFDYSVPDDPIYFTNEYNMYKTADSAEALYFHLDTINPGEKKSLSTYYGVTSNFNTLPTDRLVINAVSPTRIELDKSKVDAKGNLTGEYVGNGMFSISTSIGNTMSNGKDWNNVAVAVFTDPGLLAYDASGGSAYTNERPYQQQIYDFKRGQTKTFVWSIQAKPQERTGFKKIILKAYDMSKSTGGLLLEENVIAQSSASILVPVSTGGIAPIQFVSSTPDIIYYTGKRYINMIGYGFNIFNQKRGGWTLKAVSKSDSPKKYDVPDENINISDDEHMIISLMDNMDLGDYEFEFDWTISDSDLEVLGIDRVIKASALKFIVSDNQKYKASSYGILTVEREGRNYKINTFPDEGAMEKYYDKHEDIVNDGRLLLTLKGDFSKQSVAPAKGQPDKLYNAGGSASNVIINGVLDFKGESISVEEDDGSVKIRMDGKLLTSGSGNTVWNGLSEINLNSGKIYNLVQYDEEGDRISDEPDPLLGEDYLELKWADDYGFLQTLGGFAVNLRYGVFGNTVSTDSRGNVTGILGNVVSFGASLDLSFMTPGGARRAKARKNPPMKTADNGVASESTEEDDSEIVRPSVNMHVDDVLFGQHDNDVGFMGVKGDAKVTMPVIVKAMPGKAEGEVAIDTIGKYQVGVAGAMEWKTFNTNFELRVKQAPDSGAPVPDKLLFTIGGYEPGINIDALGGIWITGGGGGIDNLYETIYSKSAYPPLTLILQVQFDIVKVMSSTAQLELSARSFNMEFEDVKLKKSKTQILDSGRAGFAWYPGYALNLGAGLKFKDLIEGDVNLSASKKDLLIVAEADLLLPEDIPFIGGMKVTTVELGGNREKIWGKIKPLFVTMGVVYYWGDSSVIFGADVSEFGSYSTASAKMLAMAAGKPIPVAYDDKTDKTLYMAIGSNLQRVAVSGSDRSLTQEEIDRIKNGSGAYIRSFGVKALAPAPSSPTIRSNESMSAHILNLGNVPYTYLLAIEGIDGGLPLDMKDRIAITGPDGKPYVVDYYENGKDALNVTGNAVLNEGKDMVTGLYISIPEKSFQSGSWLLQADRPVKVSIVKALPGPELAAAAATVDTSSNTLNVSWDGTAFDDDTKVNVFLAKDKDDVGIGIGGTYNAGDKRTGITIPDSIASGDYYVRVILQKENSSFQSIYANDGKAVSYTNPGAPAKPVSAVLESAGNGMAKIIVPEARDNDGYMVDVLEKLPDGSWTESAQHGLIFKKDEEIIVGGSYTALGREGSESGKGGLEADKTYMAVVRSFKNGVDGTPCFFSDIKESNELLIPAYTAPVIKLSAQGGDVKEDGGIFIFKIKDVKLKLTSETDITGTWVIDSEVGGTYDAASREFGLETSLEDGEHIIEFDGRESDDKDSFIHTKKIIVDTEPPRLMMQSPVNGSLYNDGKVNIKAIVDKGSSFTIKVDGETKLENKNLDEFIDNDDMLQYSLDVGSDKLSKNVEIRETDKAGNESVFQAVINNGDLGSIRHIFIAQNGQAVGNNGVVPDETSKTAKLDAIGVTDSGREIVLTGQENLKWSAGDGTGSVDIDQSGNLAVLSEGTAYIEVNYLLSNSAFYSDSVTIAEASGDSGNETSGSGHSEAVRPVPDIPSTRLYGNSRIDTAIAISRAGWDSSDNVILVNAYNFPDALAGTAFAYSKKAPILLTPYDSIDDATMDEIERLKAKNIYILGGSGVISEDILNSLKSKNYNVVRIFGQDRYKTAVEIGRNMDTDTVVIATGNNFPDALAIGPFAAKLGYPILFTSVDSLNEDTKLALGSLGIKNAIIVGGEGVVSGSVEDEIRGLNINVERLSGGDRYLTALAIIRRFTEGSDINGIAAATGEDFPDALSGGPFAAKKGYPIILTGLNDVNPQVLEYIKKLKLSGNIYVLGGSGAVSDSVKDMLSSK